MPWAGGTYSRGYPSWSADAAGNLPISATKFDTEDNDFAAGINFCLAKDGSNEPTSTLTWVLASAPPIALTRTTTDGTVFSLARTGGANNPNFTFAVGDTAGLTIAGTSGGLNILNNGNMSIAAPSAGVALTATGFANSYTAILTAASTSGQSLGLQVKAGTTAADFALNVQNQSGGTLFMSIDGTGHTTFQGPAGATTAASPLAVVTGSAGFAQTFSDGTNTGGYIGFGGSHAIQFGTTTAQGIDFIVTNAAKMSIAAGGNVTIAAPASGNALAVTGLANSKALRVLGASTAGQSYGIQVAAGTNASDLSFEVLNQAGSTDYLYVAGDGGVVIGNPTGTTLGVGTINVQNGISINNNPVYAGIPQNVQNTTYALVLSDANKNIHKSGGIAHTDTIPANASVAFPIGTAITFTVINGASALTIAITTDTLVWSPSGTTGSRTLAGSGVATAIKVASTTWMISGSGLS